MTRDALRVDAAALGLHLAYVFGDRLPITARVAGGVLLGSFTDARTGNYTDSQGDQYSTGVVSQSSQVVYAYVGPEVRVGYRVGDHLTLSVGVLGLAMFGFTKPVWDNKQLVYAGGDGAGTYGAETLLGDFAFTVAPSLGARYDF